MLSLSLLSSQRPIGVNATSAPSASALITLTLVNFIDLLFRFLFLKI